MRRPQNCPLCYRRWSIRAASASFLALAVAACSGPTAENPSASPSIEPIGWVFIGILVVLVFVGIGVNLYSASIEKAKSGIFICYARSDTGDLAGRLADRLASKFGKGHVFYDIKSIATGQDYIDAIENTLSHCRVMIVLIGERWLNEIAKADTEGASAGASGTAFRVQQEIEAAFKNDITIIPVLAGQAEMPAISRLPSSLRNLPRINAEEIRRTTFERDNESLIRRIREITSQ